MTLITCPDCQRPVSQYAPACPACGRPINAAVYRPAGAPVQPFTTEKQNVQIAYALWAGSFVVGPLLLASVIYCYVKRGDARGSIMAAHYDWLIETFWFTMLGALLGAVVALFLLKVAAPLGIMSLFGVVAFGIGWPIYRLVKGWTALNEGRVPQDPRAAW